MVVIWTLLFFIIFSEFFIFLPQYSTVFLSRFFIWVIAWRTAIQSIPTHLFGLHFSFLISQNSNNKKYQGSSSYVFCTTYAFSRHLRIVREYKLFPTTKNLKKGNNFIFLTTRSTEADFSNSDGLRPLQLRQSNFRQFFIMNN